MTSHSRNTMSVANLMLCLFITSATAHSFIRQFTDDFKPNLQQDIEAKPIQNLDVEKTQEISSRDHKVSASSTVKGLRDLRPSSYSLKMTSFNTLLELPEAPRYQARPFAVGGYNWTFFVYPTGNKDDNGSGYLSLYVAIDKSSFVTGDEEINADLRFYIYNRKERKYFVIEDTQVWKFSSYDRMWGFSHVLSVDTFKDSQNGYLYNGGNCEFGVDVTIPSVFKTSELVSIRRLTIDRSYTWKIRGLSQMTDKAYMSDVFTIGGKKWKLQVTPPGKRKTLAMFLWPSGPFEKTYVQVKLKVLNQRKLDNIEFHFGHWFNSGGYGYGNYTMISVDDLRDSSKGFVVNDTLIVEIEFEALSSTKYFP